MKKENDNDKRPNLDLRILKANLEQMRRSVELRSGYSGIKIALGIIARELDEQNISVERIKELARKVANLEQEVRRRQEREASDKDESKTPFDRLGETMTGELRI